MAPEAETAYRKHSRRGQHDAYVAVRVRAGHPVPEEMYIAGEPILDHLEQQQASGE
jgi:hypothetical protein